jgi:hypothetical protein
LLKFNPFNSCTCQKTSDVKEQFHKFFYNSFSKSSISSAYQRFLGKKSIHQILIVLFINSLNIFNSLSCLKFVHVTIVEKMLRHHFLKSITLVKEDVIQVRFYHLCNIFNLSLRQYFLRLNKSVCVIALVE